MVLTLVLDPATVSVCSLLWAGTVILIRTELYNIGAHLNIIALNASQTSRGEQAGLGIVDVEFRIPLNLKYKFEIKYLDNVVQAVKIPASNTMMQHTKKPMVEQTDET